MNKMKVAPRSKAVQFMLAEHEYFESIREAWGIKYKQPGIKLPRVIRTAMDELNANEDLGIEV